MESYRDNKLRKLIIHCYENVPYYNNVMNGKNLKPRDIQCMNDLSKLPILTKDIIRHNTKELMARNTSKMVLSWSKTGGTTGEPIQICKNRECTAWANMCFERGLRWGGLRTDEPRINLFGGSLGIDKSRFTNRLGNLLRGDLFLPAFELRTDTAMSFFERIHRSRCRFLIGYASSIYLLASLAKQMDQRIRFEAVFPTAELMIPEWEETILSVFKCIVLPYYGCGEVNSLGYHTLSDNSYLIPEEHVIMEVMKDDKSAVQFGTGRFVITDLDNYAMPILRYVNGDAGEIVSCTNENLSFSRIKRLDGRYNNFLMNDAGDLVSGAIGPHIFRQFPSVHSYLIVQEEPLKITIDIVPNENFDDENEYHIMKLFGRYLGNKMRIIIRKVTEIPRSQSGKVIFVINRCLDKGWSQASDG
jgi:phenylacetate-CoA ligase